MLACENCGSTLGVEHEGSRTAYARERLSCWQRLKLDGEGLGEQPDPNRDPWLCRDCAAEHHAYWDEQWDEYHRGLL